MVHIIALSAALALLHDVNRERRTHGLPPLAIDARLSSAAESHADEMARSGSFSHDSIDGASPFDRMRQAGCRFAYAAENIALASSADQADTALFDSAPHRENTLSGRYQRIGIGVAQDASGEMYVVEDFSN